jgi:TIR domain
LTESKDAFDIVREIYGEFVRKYHPDLQGNWPVLSGADLRQASYCGWTVLFFKHTGNVNIRSTSGVGELPMAAGGVSAIDAGNLEAVRERLYRHFRAQLDDGLVLVPPSGEVRITEFARMLERHETAMGVARMKVFLSHKSPDKSMVREFKALLDTLGFDAWLDEDAMTAGAHLDRSILQGMEDSCAAVFFITPQFSDESFLAAEINYAIQQQRKRPAQFSIVTIVIAEGGVKPDVPGLLKSFVWKEPASLVDAFREIVRALPIKVGPVTWR